MEFFDADLDASGSTRWGEPGCINWEDGVTGVPQSGGKGNADVPEFEPVREITDADGSVAGHNDGVHRASEEEEGVDQPSWTRRRRVGRAPPERPVITEHLPLRNRSGGFVEKKGSKVINPEVGMTFDSLSEAYDFYNIYSWENGFGIRYGKSRVNVHRIKCMQQLVCAYSGKPERSNSRSIRCSCEALVRLLRTKDSGWYIAEYKREHNHSLLQGKFYGAPVLSN